MLIYAGALGAFLFGVSLTERPNVAGDGLLTKAYYALSLFVVGGLDIGTPTGGPAWARILLWGCYFGAPLLTASAVIDALARALSPSDWQLRNLHDHVVVVGGGNLTDSILRLLRKHIAKRPIVVVNESVQPVRQLELEQTYDAIVIDGDITHDFLLKALRLDRASLCVLATSRDFQAYEAASRMLARFPHLTGRILLLCQNLRFMRAMGDTSVARQCRIFNPYHLAAEGMVRMQLREHFRKTSGPDTIVIAGFGRFGQSVLEELQIHASADIDRVAVIDSDADRRLLVAAEQERIRGPYQLTSLEGDISHPEVWHRLERTINLADGFPVIILGTGNTAENLRAATWIKQRHANALVFARTNDLSSLASEVGSESGVAYFSIKQLLEDHLPTEWLA